MCWGSLQQPRLSRAGHPALLSWLSGSRPELPRLTQSSAHQHPELVPEAQTLTWPYAPMKPPSTRNAQSWAGCIS